MAGNYHPQMVGLLNMPSIFHTSPMIFHNWPELVSFSPQFLRGSPAPDQDLIEDLVERGHVPSMFNEFLLHSLIMAYNGGIVFLAHVLQCHSRKYRFKNGIPRMGYDNPKWMQVIFGSITPELIINEQAGFEYCSVWRMAEALKNTGLFVGFCHPQRVLSQSLPRSEGLAGSGLSNNPIKPWVRSLPHGGG